MHSSRMRTARSSSRQLGGFSLSACWDTPPSPLGVGLEPPPWVWAWNPPSCGPGHPPRCGPGDSPVARPLNLSLGVGLETPPGQTPQPPLGVGLEPPWARPLKLPLGVGLETCKACWDTPPLETCKACWGTTCKACWDTTSPL